MFWPCGKLGGTTSAMNMNTPERAKGQPNRRLSGSSYNTGVVRANRENTQDRTN